jgi:hypothetical protein
VCPAKGDDGRLSQVVIQKGFCSAKNNAQYGKIAAKTGESGQLCVAIINSC